MTVEQLRAEGFSERVLAALDSVTKRDGEGYMDLVQRAGADPIGRQVTSWPTWPTPAWRVRHRRSRVP